MKTISWTSFLLVISLNLPLAQAAVWTHSQEWSPQAEASYSHWVKTKFSADIFWKTGAYPDISTDCADSVYAMRMIFAYENSLPFAMKQSDAVGGLLTNEAKKFDGVRDPRERFIAFLKYVMGRASTNSLADDTYPIEITRESLTPGTIYLATGTHVYQVIDVTDGGTTLIQYSTVPRAVRVMSRVDMFPNYVPGDLKVKGRTNVDGFRRFKQPHMYKIADSMLPHYSLEQYTKAQEFAMSGLKFYEWAQNRLAIRPETPHEKIQRSLLLVCYASWDRGEAVNDGVYAFHLKKVKDRQNLCFNAREYDNYSTPTRDKRLINYFESLHLLPDTPGYNEYRGEMKEMIDQIIGRTQNEKTENRLLEWCDINKQVGGPGRPMSLTELHDLALSGRLVSDPHANTLQRWGLEPFTPTCQQY
ncbi:MAG: hypothetical protein IPM97_11445 [Bdellovibrionaceae bacterium]|nr:hypothetical protein [Pseudobdellovibrionaceae bacterium]